MTRALIIAMGNPLRGDDGFGWHVIEQLRESEAEERAELLACHQLTPELAAPLAQSNRVIFIDAAAGEPAGEVRVQRIDGIDASGPAPEAFSHRLDPHALARHARELYGKLPEMVMVSVKGATYGFTEHLSAPVLKAVPEVLRLIEDMLKTDPPALSVECGRLTAE